MLQVNDKIKYVKENKAMGIPLNTVLTVKEIHGVALKVEGSCVMRGMECVIQGVMSYDEVEKHFEKVVEKEQLKWTDWRTISSSELHKIVRQFDSAYAITSYLRDYLLKTICKFETRNNGRKTEVRAKLYNNTIKATATCNKVDKYNEETGIKVAIIKLFVKKIAELSKIYINEHY